MKKCVYPLIIYADKEENCYVGLFPDLDITACGNTVEETFVLATDSLKMFIEFASKMESDLSSPSTYVEAIGMNPKRVVLLSLVEVDVDNLQLTQSEEDYKQFLANMLISEEN